MACVNPTREFVLFDQGEIFLVNMAALQNQKWILTPIYLLEIRPVNPRFYHGVGCLD